MMCVLWRKKVAGEKVWKKNNAGMNNDVVCEIRHKRSNESEGIVPKGCCVLWLTIARRWRKMKKTHRFSCFLEFTILQGHFLSWISYFARSFFVPPPPVNPYEKWCCGRDSCAVYYFPRNSYLIKMLWPLPEATMSTMCALLAMLTK